MKRYILVRLAWAVVTVLSILVINFLVIHLVPGDPIQALVGDVPAPPEYVDSVRRDFGLDQPLEIQLLRYFANLAQGNLGFSFANRQPILELYTGSRSLYLAANASGADARRHLGHLSWHVFCETSRRDRRRPCERIERARLLGSNILAWPAVDPPIRDQARGAAGTGNGFAARIPRLVSVMPLTSDGISFFRRCASRSITLR